MDSQVERKINHINQEFYQRMAGSFSATRRRIQPGVASLLETIQECHYWLDIGCGNGTLAHAWMKKFPKSRYVGCDFSSSLIEEAQKKISAPGFSGEPRLDFLQIDISQPDWQKHIPHLDWDVITMFAVLHHIPSAQTRKRICQQIRNLLPRGKELLLSIWQLQNSPRLLSRIQAWERIGLKTDLVEEGDVLMDWRSEIASSLEPALRYVHIFHQDELEDLAMDSGFEIASSFYSDGKEGNLALYQVWN